MKLQFMSNIVICEPDGNGVRFFGMSRQGRMLFVIGKRALLDCAHVREATPSQLLTIFRRHWELIAIAAQRKYDANIARDPLEIVLESEDLRVPVVVS
jgi:hypothetical protein